MKHGPLRHSTALLGLLGAGLLSAWAFNQDGPQDEWKAPARQARKKNPFPADDTSIATGRKLYVRECLSCHGEAGEGDGPAAKDLEKKPGDLADPRAMEQTDGALYWKITAGRKPMPTFEKLLSDEERWHVVNYVRTLGPKETVTPPEFDVPEPFRRQVSGVVTAYLSLADRLAKDDPESSRQGVHALRDSFESLQGIEIKGLEGKALEAWKDSVEALRNAIEELRNLMALEALRRAFGRLTVPLVQAVARFGHAHDKPLRVFHCPMALNNTGADWIQGEAEPRNPYGGAAMLRCGQVARIMGAASHGESPRK